VIDTEVRRVVYETAMRSGRIPLAEEIAGELAVSRGEVVEAFRRLAEAHVLVTQRDREEILMAMPFSAVPTPFVVESGGIRAYGNCMWDALGVSAMLQADAAIATSCPDCGTAAMLTIANEEVQDGGVVHFALPVKKWWNDVVFT
jgi:hypothetical protein